MNSLPVSPVTLEAVRILADAGVSDQVLGSVVREILNRHGGSPAVPTTESLGAAPGFGSPAAVADSQQAEAPAEPSPGQASLPAVAPAPTKPGSSPVPIKVRFPDGHATNLTIPADLLAAAEAKMGGDKEARKWVRELALQTPDHVSNRSRWVQEQVAKALSD
jgi:hypothetical protein